MFFRFRGCGELRTLNRQPSTVNPQLSTLNRQPSTVNRQPSTVNLQPSTLNSLFRIKPIHPFNTG
jgi:hypothetical protein